MINLKTALYGAQSPMISTRRRSGSRNARNKTVVLPDLSFAPDIEGLENRILLSGVLPTSHTFMDASGDQVTVSLSGAGGFQMQLDGGASNNADIDIIRIIGGDASTSLSIHVTPQKIADAVDTQNPGVWTPGHTSISAIAVNDAPVTIGNTTFGATTALNGIALNGVTPGNIDLGGVDVGNLSLSAAATNNVDVIMTANTGGLAGSGAGYAIVAPLVDFGAISANSITTLTISGHSTIAGAGANNFEGNIEVTNDIGTIRAIGSNINGDISVGGGIGSIDLGSSFGAFSGVVNGNVTAGGSISSVSAAAINSQIVSGGDLNVQTGALAAGSALIADGETSVRSNAFGGEIYTTGALTLQSGNSFANFNAYVTAASINDGADLRLGTPAFTGSLIATEGDIGNITFNTPNSVVGGALIAMEGSVGNITGGSFIGTTIIAGDGDIGLLTANDTTVANGLNAVVALSEGDVGGVLSIGGITNSSINADGHVGDIAVVNGNINNLNVAADSVGDTDVQGTVNNLRYTAGNIGFIEVVDNSGGAGSSFNNGQINAVENFEGISVYSSNGVAINNTNIRVIDGDIGEVIAETNAGANAINNTNVTTEFGSIGVIAAESVEGIAIAGGSYFFAGDNIEQIFATSVSNSAINGANFRAGNSIELIVAEVGAPAAAAGNAAIDNAIFSAGGNTLGDIFIDGGDVLGVATTGNVTFSTIGSIGNVDVIGAFNGNLVSGIDTGINNNIGVPSQFGPLTSGNLVAANDAVLNIESFNVAGNFGGNLLIGVVNTAAGAINAGNVAQVTENSTIGDINISGIATGNIFSGGSLYEDGIDSSTALIGAQIVSFVGNIGDITVQGSFEGLPAIGGGTVIDARGGNIGDVTAINNSNAGAGGIDGLTLLAPQGTIGNIIGLSNTLPASPIVGHGVANMNAAARGSIGDITGYAVDGDGIFNVMVVSTHGSVGDITGESADIGDGISGLDVDVAGDIGNVVGVAVDGDGIVNTDLVADGSVGFITGISAEIGDGIVDLFAGADGDIGDVFGMAEDGDGIFDVGLFAEGNIGNITGISNEFGDGINDLLADADGNIGDVTGEAADGDGLFDVTLISNEGSVGNISGSSSVDGDGIDQLTVVAEFDIGDVSGSAVDGNGIVNSNLTSFEGSVGNLTGSSSEDGNGIDNVNVAAEGSIGVVMGSAVDGSGIILTTLTSNEESIGDITGISTEAGAGIIFFNATAEGDIGDVTGLAADGDGLAIVNLTSNEGSIGNIAGVSTEDGNGIFDLNAFAENDIGDVTGEAAEGNGILDSTLTANEGSIGDITGTSSVEGDGIQNLALFADGSIGDIFGAATIGHGINGNFQSWEAESISSITGIGGSDDANPGFHGIANLDVVAETGIGDIDGISVGEDSGNAFHFVDVVVTDGDIGDIGGISEDGLVFNSAAFEAENIGDITAIGDGGNVTVDVDGGSIGDITASDDLTVTSNGDVESIGDITIGNDLTINNSLNGIETIGNIEARDVTFAVGATDLEDLEEIGDIELRRLALSGDVGVNTDGLVIGSIEVERITGGVTIGSGNAGEGIESSGSLTIDNSVASNVTLNVTNIGQITIDDATADEIEDGLWDGVDPANWDVAPVDGAGGAGDKDGVTVVAV